MEGRTPRPPSGPEVSGRFCLLTPKLFVIPRSGGEEPAVRPLSTSALHAILKTQFSTASTYHPVTNNLY
jgi:hypothetical protein